MFCSAGPVHPVVGPALVKAAVKVTVMMTEHALRLSGLILNLQLGCEQMIEPPHEKINNLHMRKQRRRPAAWLLRRP